MSGSSFNVLYTRSVNKIADFWDNLGIEILKQEVDKVVVKVEGFDLHYILDTTEPFLEYQFATAQKYRGRGVLFYFEYPDLEALSSKLAGLSPSYLTPVKDNHWDGQELLFSDPDGYLFVAYRMK